MIAAHQTMLAPQETWPVPLYTGVSLVGSSVQNNNGVLSGFTSSSYAKLPFKWTAGATSVEACIRINTSGSPAAGRGIWGCVGSTDAFTPFYLADIVGTKKVTTWLSSNGSTWDINDGGYSTRLWYVIAAGDSAYTMRISFSPTTGYKCMAFGSGSWSEITSISNASAPYGTTTLEMELGNNRGQNNPFDGTIDLNYTYLYRDGELWWEGVAGAYRNVKTTYPD